MVLLVHHSISQQSRKVRLIMAEKKLLIFPLISAFAMIVLIALIISGLLTWALLTGAPAAAERKHWLSLPGVVNWRRH